MMAYHFPGGSVFSCVDGQFKSRKSSEGYQLGDIIDIIKGKLTLPDIIKPQKLIAF
jgi:hypothetical protein